MENEFVNYNQALALKELGFDEPCFLGYKMEDFFELFTKGLVYNSIYETFNETTNLSCTAPLKQQAFRWFREKYDLQYWLNDGGMLSKCFIKITGYKHDKFYFSSSEPMEYEEAEDACLDKLIEICKTK